MHFLSRPTTDRGLDATNERHRVAAHFRAFLDHSSSVAWMKDEAGRHVYLSKPYLDLIGVPCDEWCGKTDFDFWPESMAIKFRSLDREVLRSGESIEFQDEESVTLPHGRKRLWWVTKFPVYDHEGNGYVGGIAVDITESRETAEALRLQHEFSDRLIESARNIVLVLDTQGRIVRFNHYLQELAGWHLSDVQGKRFSDVYFPGPDREQSQRRFENALHRDHERGHLQPLVSRDGESLIIEWFNTPLHDVDCNPEGVLCIGADITQRRSLERKIEQIAQDEHKRIGQELHDGVGQELTALCIFCEHLVEKLDRFQSQALPNDDRLEVIQTLARKIATTSASMRTNVQQLSRTMVTGDGGGSDTLYSLLTGLVATTDAIPGLRCRFDCGEIYPLDGASALHLFRIAQEAVNNAIKHADASEIAIGLHSDADCIHLVITDDGCGFDGSPSGGVGQQVMRYRAELISADIDIEPNEPRGIRVRCTMNHSHSETS